MPLKGLLQNGATLQDRAVKIGYFKLELSHVPSVRNDQSRRFSAPTHRYRYFKQVLTDQFIAHQLGGLSKVPGRTGYGIERLFNCLLLQFMEDLSDRECELFLQENVEAKWFCGLGLSESVPDHTVLCRVRKRIGTKQLSRLFLAMRDELSRHGLVSEVYSPLWMRRI